MTAEGTAAERVGRPRPRPQVHFTADEGWINDPYGVTWRDGAYHLYFQAVPGRVTWAPDCHWGHAVSRDLVHWQEQPLALVPQPFEVGCWSGSVVDDAGAPLIFYTRISGSDWDIGQVAVATLDEASGAWRTTAADVVVAGPPAGLGARCFRDPHVFRSEHGWRMLMAAALPEGVAAVVQYSSADLRNWGYDGVVCSRSREEAGDVFTGSLWECPQLFPLGDDWVLLVSVWDDGRLFHEAAALGSYDGTTFRPRRWQRLTYGSSAYAMTTFLDREGRRCVMSWLREEPQEDPALPERAGAQSVVSTLTPGAGDRLVLRPHPRVDAALAPPLDGRQLEDGTLRYDVPETAVDLRLAGSRAARCDVVDGDELRARLVVEPGGTALRIERPGRPEVELPVGPGDGRVRVLLDADILEVFTPGRYGAYRIAPAADPAAAVLVLQGQGAAAAEVRCFRGS